MSASTNFGLKRTRPLLYLVMLIGKCMFVDSSTEYMGHFQLCSLFSVGCLLVNKVSKTMCNFFCAFMVFVL